MNDFSAKHDFLRPIEGRKSGVIRDLLPKGGWKGKGKVAVELGGCLGYSAILFADILRTSDQENGSVKIFSLELSEEFATIAKEIH